MYQLMTNNQFNQELAKTGHATVEVNKLWDKLLWDAFHQAMPANEGGHGNLQRLTAIIGMAEHTKGINVRKMQAYIQAHVDCKWTKNNSGTHSFSFRDKPSVTLPEMPWFAYNHPSDKAKVDVDVVKEIKRLLNKAAKEGANVEGTEVLSDLQDFAIKHGIRWQHKPTKAAAGKQKVNRSPAAMAK